MLTFLFAVVVMLTHTGPQINFSVLEIGTDFGLVPSATQSK